MSVEDITLAAQAMNNLREQFGGFYTAADAQIAQRRGAYDALAADLRGVVAQQLNFTATWDPTAAEPTNVRGGVFTSLAALIGAAPKGALVTAYVTAGRTLHLTENITLGGRRLRLEAQGAGAKPRITVDTRITGGTNLHYYIVAGALGDGLEIVGCVLDIAGKVDAGLPWNGYDSVVAPVSNGNAPMIFRGNRVDFVATDTAVLIDPALGSTVIFNTEYCTASGPITLVKNAASNVILSAHQALTLSNGAVKHNGGTSAGNILTI
ncbi:hypothetical protein [Novosphingopyxis sp. YJ-S2-01]|uniref:hypothetical protein n=1 Tax=Novosphingopyxis sp. YJ-S2-01 TaxID=2794021 RepID=UPI0018DC5076|nr:hypothetical protein [Novosphingopyxis sp. YJ-S2-01]MBH9537903.1 hypothetical protein [Novosphingopyxis sp. YJ-S2-01]